MRPRILASLAALVALGALAAGALQHAGGALPIPSVPPLGQVTGFTGRPATARPLPAQHVPRHPFMAANGRSNIHDDAYQSDAYNGPGPLGRNLRISSTLFVAECASVTFDSHGRIVTVCPSPTGATVRLIDPTSLATLAAYDLPPRKLGTFSFSNFSGGGYFYLDNHDRAVVTTFTSHLVVLAEQGTKFAKVRDVDLSEATGGEAIESALPDWSGRIWFITKTGVVGFVTRDGQVRSRHLHDGETIDNSFAVDESGGVFVVSDHALYRFDVRRAKPVVTWRRTYDRGTRIKPGQVGRGSGTTPTLIGSAKSKGGGSIAITDNADPRMHVLVLHRGKAGPGRPLCDQPVFDSRTSADENSLISVPGGLIAENNYGYDGPLPTHTGLRSADTRPGLVRIDVDRRHGGCHVVWRNDTARVPTLVSKVSLATGLLYSYTHPAPAEIPWQGAVLPAALSPDAWFFTAFDVRTGKQVWSKYVGSGLGYNNNYAPVTLGPGGVAYVGVLGGLLRIADS